jgi:hypothetical protein
VQSSCEFFNIRSSFESIIDFPESWFKKERVEGTGRFCGEKGLEGGEATEVRLDGNPPANRRKWQAEGLLLDEVFVAMVGGRHYF